MNARPSCHCKVLSFRQAFLSGGHASSGAWSLVCSRRVLMDGQCNIERSHQRARAHKICQCCSYNHLLWLQGGLKLLGVDSIDSVCASDLGLVMMVRPTRKCCWKPQVIARLGPCCIPVATSMDCWRNCCCSRTIRRAMKDIRRHRAT